MTLPELFEERHAREELSHRQGVHPNRTLKPIMSTWRVLVRSGIPLKTQPWQERASAFAADEEKWQQEQPCQWCHEIDGSQIDRESQLGYERVRSVGLMWHKDEELSFSPRRARRDRFVSFVVQNWARFS